MKETMIRNIIFDLGGVLIDFHPLDCLLRLGYDKKKALEILNATVKDEIWQEMDRGIYTKKEEYIKAFENKYPLLKDDIKKFLDSDWMKYSISYIKENLVLIDFAKKHNCKYYILSNYPKDAFEYTYDLYDFIQNADGRIVSSFVKCNKPEKEIYLKLLDKYKLEASECVFIDDLEVNIKGASDVGINGIVYKNLADTLEKLNKFICKEEGK